RPRRRRGRAGRPVRRARPRARWSRRPGSSLEARSRVGGRVEQVTLDDGRIVQLGGEVIGNSHTAYQELVAELGLTLIPSYVAEPGELPYVLHEGTFVGETPTWFSDADHRSMTQVELEFA